MLPPYVTHTGGFSLSSYSSSLEEVVGKPKTTKEEDIPKGM